MGTHQQRLLNALTPLLERYGGMGAWRTYGAPVRSRKCIIHRLIGPPDAPALAIKEYRSEIVKNSAAHTQYNGLLFAVGHPSHEGSQEEHMRTGETSAVSVSAVRPFAYLPQYNAIVMEWVNAPSLASIIVKNQPTELNHSILSAARWLQGFHALSVSESEQIDTEALLGRLRKRLSASARYKKNKLVCSAVQEIERLSATPLLAPHAYLHGDFTPSNILIDTEGPVGIDIWARRHAAVYEDIARMLIYLGSKGTGFWEHKALVNDFDGLCQNFIAAYGATSEQLASDAFRFVLLYQTVRRWLVMADWAKYRHPPIAARAKRRRLETILQPLVG